MNAEFVMILTNEGGAFVDMDGAPQPGAWVTLTLTTGREITGIASYDAGQRVVTIFRQTGKDRLKPEWTFADTPHYIEPAHIVMLAFAEAGA